MNRSTIMRAIVSAAVGMGGALAAHATLTFHNTITGEVLNLNEASKEGRDTEAVKVFLETGTNLYNEQPSCLKKGEQLFLAACSGCHGHHGEGKIGPGVNDNYWTYPKNETDKGLFETIFGGAKAQMGPMYGALTLDEMLLAMAWVRHLYNGDVNDAVWLTEEQRKAFKPYSERLKDAAADSGNPEGECKPRSM
jgi:cytochrome c-L